MQVCIEIFSESLNVNTWVLGYHNTHSTHNGVCVCLRFMRLVRACDISIESLQGVDAGVLNCQNCGSEQKNKIFRWNHVISFHWNVLIRAKCRAPILRIMWNAFCLKHTICGRPCSMKRTMCNTHVQTNKNRCDKL